MKIKRLDYYFKLANTNAEQSKDAETKVGAVLFNSVTDSPVAHGYNGFPRGVNDSILPTTRPEKYPYMLHAEDNIRNNLIQNGTSVNVSECFLVCTHSPCWTCLINLWNCGLTKIVYEHEHHTFEEVKNNPIISLDTFKLGKYTVIELGVK